MTRLASEKCEACRADSPKVSQAEAAGFLAELPGWQIVTDDGIDKLSRTYKFKDWNEALAFTNRVGEIAEEAGHHPAVLTEWGKVTVSWWTHKINGLHRNDFIMAARTDALAGG